jgi:hypothetical protein
MTALVTVFEPLPNQTVAQLALSPVSIAGSSPAVGLDRAGQLVTYFWGSEPGRFEFGGGQRIQEPTLH